MSEQLTPGPPTTTGTYFAVIKYYVSDEPQMCVLHYQSHKNLYRAVGHAFNVEVKADDIVGYVGEKRGAEWVKAEVRVPNNRNLVHLNYYTQSTELKTTGYYEPEKKTWHRQDGDLLDWHPNLEWLDESGTAAGREEDDRNEFAEWCRMQPNYGFIRGIGWRCSITQEVFSTDFMYQLFKQQKEK